MIIKQLQWTLTYLISSSVTVWLLGLYILGNDCLIRTFCLRFMFDEVLYVSKVHGYSLDIFISNDANSH